MKKVFVLLTILILPAIIYIYFAMGIPKVSRAPIYGPRKVVEVSDPESGEVSTDTIYHRIPAFRYTTTGGLVFDSKAILDGRSYIAVFVPLDSIKSMFTMLSQDMKYNKRGYGYARFVFFVPGDSLGNPPVNAPDIGRDLGMGADTAFTVFMPPAEFDSVRTNYYFVKDPARKTDPWQTTTDAVLIDRLGRIRGYYNIRFVAEMKKMKEDVNHILLRDEGVQTLEESKVEQKR
jgi:hypothetical protein